MQKFWRFTTGLLLVFLLIPPPSAYAQATRQESTQSKPYLLRLNGEEILHLPPPWLQDNALYVPVQLAENLGLRVELDETERSARLIQAESFYVLKEGSHFVRWQQEGLRIANVPVWKHNTLFVPLSFFIQAGALIQVGKFSHEINITKPLNQLKAIRSSTESEATRLVLDLDQVPVYRTLEADKSLTVELLGAYFKESLQLPGKRDVLLKDLQLEKTDAGKMRLRISKNYPTPNRIAWLENPHRLVIDLVRIFKQEKESQLAPKVKYVHSYEGWPFGPLKAYTLEIGPGAGVSLEPELAGNGSRGFAKEAVSQMARRRQALAAINGTYFGAGGLPLGLLLKNGELISSPLYNRSVLFWTRDQQVLIDQTQLSAAMELPQLGNLRVPFHAVNLYRQSQQMVLYTPRYGTSSATKPDPYAVEMQLLSDGTVQLIGTHNLEIPADGFVISAHGKPAVWLRANLKEGMRAIVYSELAATRLKGVYHALSGGPRLLEKGRIRVTADEERFQPDVAKGRAPRSAIGIGPAGEVILAVIDGRQEISYGMTLQELAQFMKSKGAVEALNLDGGGSSTLVIRGQVVNRPSDGKERPVSNALLILPKGASRP